MNIVDVNVSKQEKEFNTQEIKIIDEILKHPNVVSTTKHKPRYGYIVDYKIPTGQGVRFRADGSNKFLGFLEPTVRCTNQFNITIVYTPDKEIFAEITSDNIFIADIIKKIDIFDIIFETYYKSCWIFDDLVRVLELAKKELLSR